MALRSNSEADATATPDEERAARKEAARLALASTDTIRADISAVLYKGRGL